MSEGSHSYYDWQVSTLMLAYDAIEPLHRTDDAGLEAREKKVQLELQAMVQSVLPEDYRLNPERDFPPGVVVLLTTATLRRAAEIVGVL